MSDKQNILMIGVERPLFRRAASPLLRRIFEIDRIPSVAGALELTAAVPFSALILRYPLPGMDLGEFLARVKANESASSSAPVALIVNDDAVDDASQFLQHGVDLVASLDGEPEQLENELCRMLGVLPRQDMRVLVKLRVTLNNAHQDRFVAQMRDISASGMFVITPKVHPVGSRADFEFTLPGIPRPFRGRAEVARHAKPELDSTRGMGFKFIEFEGGRQHLLRLYLDREQQAGEADA